MIILTALLHLNSDLHLLNLECSLKEGQFLTLLDFKTQVVSDHEEVVGELANFLIQPDNNRKYISGMVFTHLKASNTKIAGDTGDPSDLIGRFTLTPLDGAFTGRWAYWFQRSETEVMRATFNCIYHAIPPVHKWHRP